MSKYIVFVTFSKLLEKVECWVWYGGIQSNILFLPVQPLGSIELRIL